MDKYKVSVGMFGVHDLCGGDPHSLVDVAKMADDAGIHQLSFTDHVIMSENTGVYPFGDFPVPPEYPWFEPMTLMSVVAGVTENVRLATSVLIAPLRPAALLAKMAATLDVLSNGRLDLGIGMGWQKEEYQACGMDFDNRMQLFDDHIITMKALWTQHPVSLKLPSINFDKLYSLPMPVQQGGVPLWYGIKPNALNCERIAKTGSGWLPIQSRVDFIEPAVQKLRAAFEKEGRKAKDLKVRAVAPIGLDSKSKPSVAHARDVIEPLVEAGATHIEFMPYMYVQKKEDFKPFFKEIATFGQG